MPVSEGNGADVGAKVAEETLVLLVKLVKKVELEHKVAVELKVVKV